MKTFMPLAATLVCLLTATTAVAQDVAAGEQRFRLCLPCHAIGEGAANRLGPALNNIVNRPAASVPGFAYSLVLMEMRDAGLEWTPEKLAEFLRSPRDFSPGSKMAFAGMRNEDDIANVIAYLESFTRPETPPAPRAPTAP
jgi:cytochrome c